MAGQPITDENELKQSPIPSYTNMQLASDSEVWSGVTAAIWSV